MKRKRVLVCGASGFLGRNIFERLSLRKDLDVFGTYYTKDLGRTDFVRANLATKKSVQRIVRDFDVIIQAAATTAGSKAVNSAPHYFITDNVIMNSLLLQAAHENKISHFIFLSCSVMYPYDKVLVKETDVKLNKIHPKYYMGARLKLFVEDLGRFYSELGRTRFTAIRHPNMYGPYDKFDLDKSHVFGATVSKVMNSSDKIVIWGKGKEKRDLLYVSDLVDFVEMVIKGPDYDFEIFNVGSGFAVSVSDLAGRIMDVSGKNLVIEYDKTKPVIDVNWTLDFTEATRQFGWYPKVSLDEGIRKTITWYKRNILGR